ncbi:MAG: hypothetical protein ACTS27_09060 [Phycisphaerales bacterium]
MWEITKFVAAMRNDYNIELPQEFRSSRPSAAELFDACRNSDAPPATHQPLRTLHKVRNNGSSHLNRQAAKNAIDQHFDDLVTDPLLISHNKSAFRTTSPLAIKALIFYCLGENVSEADASHFTGVLAKLLSDLIQILFFLQNPLSRGLETYVRKEGVA